MFVMRVLPSPRAVNIVVLFDESLSMVPQVIAMCKSAFYHPRKISLIRKHLTFDAAQLLVRALEQLLHFFLLLLHILCTVAV